MSAQTNANLKFSRRDFLKLGIAGTAAMTLAGSKLVNSITTAKAGLTHYTEVYPISPLILSPFVDELPIPKALAPIAIRCRFLGYSARFQLWSAEQLWE